MASRAGLLLLALGAQLGFQNVAAVAAASASHVGTGRSLKDVLAEAPSGFPADHSTLEKGKVAFFWRWLIVIVAVAHSG
eukprot:Skav225789  [mRNA]  locus=scaffold2147:115362:117792:+ [translate_table: standard]